MTLVGRYRQAWGIDEGAHAEGSFIPRGYGGRVTLPLRYQEPLRDTPAKRSPEARLRRAKLLWIKLNQGVLHPSAAAAVKRDYAREFARFEKGAK